MPKTDEIFVKDDTTDEPEIVKKPKRKLTEKQLANLAKGRAKMAEKRRLAREGNGKPTQKQIIKEEKKAVKEIKKEKKEAKKKKK
jgi:hypothetical protein